MRTGHLVLLALLFAGCRSHRSTVFGHLSGGADATRTETHALDLAAGARLELSTPHGRVEARAVAGSSPGLTATLRSSGRTAEEAAMVLQSYTLAIEQDHEVLRVALEGKPVRVSDPDARLFLGASVDYVVTVPEAVELTVQSQSGDIVVEGAFAACRLETRYGDITVLGVHGDVSALSGSGDVAVRDTTGNRVRVESGYGVLQLQNITATDVHAESKSGDLTLASARADHIRLDTRYGAIAVHDAEGAVRASSRSGTVELSGVRGDIVAESQYGRLAVEGVLTGLRARSSSGDVHVRALDGSTNTTDWDLSSGYGRVTLEVPAAFGCRLEASTRYGDVECAFPVTIDGGKRKNGALRGTVGAGGRVVAMSSGSGNVTLRQL
ncbi:MAG: DUF4097 family beta strand repeat protein [Planctomycetes bacterium]|nr:DUF4097 family beta strand repeat protein [Planctomycetota bacterium]